MLKFPTALTSVSARRKLNVRCIEMLKKQLTIPVKGLECENYFPLLVTSHWFSYLERHHFSYHEKSGQKQSEVLLWREGFSLC